MKKKVISALIALIIVIPIIILGGYAYYFGVGVLSLLAFYEIVKVKENDKKIPLPIKIITLMMYLSLILSVCKNYGDFNIDYRLFILSLFTCILPIVVFKKDKYNVEDAFYLSTSTILLSLAFGYAIIIRNMNLHYLIYILLITIMADTFANFIGSKIGKRKLAPLVSPNKTVEGFVGGIVFSTFISSVYFITFVNTNARLFLVIMMSLALSVIAELGDLVFSAIKRKYGVKDFGNIMPGHGGILDRLDSIIFAILAFSYLLSFF